MVTIRADQKDRSEHGGFEGYLREVYGLKESVSYEGMKDAGYATNRHVIFTTGDGEEITCHGSSGSLPNGVYSVEFSDDETTKALFGKTKQDLIDIKKN